MSNRGPPDHARNRSTERQEDGTIKVGKDRREEARGQINWNNLSPFEEYVLLVLDDMGAFD